MADIILAIPKSAMLSAGAADDFYYVELPSSPEVSAGDRVYFMEDGYVRGYAIMAYTEYGDVRKAPTTDRSWKGLISIFMDRATWRSVKPIEYCGFRGWRYAKWKHEKVEITGQ